MLLASDVEPIEFVVKRAQDNFWHIFFFFFFFYEGYKLTGGYKLRQQLCFLLFGLLAVPGGLKASKFTDCS